MHQKNDHVFSWLCSTLFIPLILFTTSYAAQAMGTQEYWIAAEKTDWNYAPSGGNQIDPEEGLGVYGNTLAYTKYRYIGYTDSSYSQPLPQPEWMGILGPTIRAVVGDTIQVHFLNNTDLPLSIHPHGVMYNKDNEGADGGAGGSVPPGGRYTYTWVVDRDAGPGPDDPSSVAWLYHSHVAPEHEINLGLIGTIIITAANKARHSKGPVPRDIDQEFIALYMIFNEENDEESGLKHTINGRIFGNLSGFETTLGQRVRWHLMALGNEVDNHTVHWHGQTVLDHDRRTDVIELMPASMKSVDMVPRSPGNWLFHCHVNDHMMAGMSTRWLVK
ncbi:copper oxidase [Nitrosomonas sp. HPC101]|uniref:multicopper oxidase domain-containing protein n=1 Tax=Nitrosomonas sp. HPC101 TaxID=1658667 RepID=UPI00136E048F|nr:multicopper oxidase domain-containing protein [Nitrosomonas sp. HPC101]MXS85884.1 copper oxidase [Nitrosomonas sp. HPC101]